jgi:oligosaccharide repeat unit polymerase
MRPRPPLPPVRVLSPSAIFITVFVLLNLLPALYIYFWNHQENLYIGISSAAYREATRLYIGCILIFVTVLVVSRYVLFRGASRLLYIHDSPPRGDAVAWRLRPRILNIVKVLGLIGVALTFLYLLFGGYEKLLLLGSDLGSRDFRLIGFDDRSRVLIAGLELSRRLLLPIAALLLMVAWKVGLHRRKLWLLALLLLSQVLAAAMTLDRAPVLLFVVMLIYPALCMHRDRWQLVGTVFKTIAIIIVVAGITTFLQYNVLGFDVWLVLTTGIAFLLHRTILVPSIASIELGFTLFPADSEKLLLAYSRLRALFGSPYIGSQEQLSIYVTPVGAIADVWRNFGLLGVVVVPLILGWFLQRCDVMTRRAAPLVWIVSSFNMFSLALYLVFGVMFSQGVLAHMVVTYIFLKYMPAERHAPIPVSFEYAQA